jgi:predicted acylesterase/phospholipase RssA
MPISGSRFANQIALAKHLIELGYQPDIIMGTSGGCITGMVLIICGISSVKCQDSYDIFCHKLNQVLKELDNTWYLSPWSSYSVINTVIGIKEGSLFNRGNGENFAKQLDIDLEGQPEMWIGTRCKNTAQSQVFCTKSKKNSKIRMNGAIYMDGDVKLTTKATVASCAVPTIVPGIEINGLTYSDGGVIHASPLGPCTPAYAKGQISYHIVYISPVRYNSKDDPISDEIEDDDIWNKLKSSTTGMVTGLHLPDRNNGIRMVGPDAIKKVGRGRIFLKKALDLQLICKRSFIEVAPINGSHINFLTMKKGDVLTSVNNAYDAGFSVRHWYLL